MELRHLRCFFAVAEELHFACAAERLHIDQSPLSHTIKELEEDLGAPLFVRNKRSTRLTRAGKLFLEHVPRVFALDQARTSVEAAAAGFHDQLRIALSGGITPLRLSSLMAMCRQEDPDIAIHFSEVSLSQQLKGLHEDLYDVEFAQSADDVGDGILATLAWSDPVHVAVPARHPLLTHKRIPLNEVLRYRRYTNADRRRPPSCSQSHARFPSARASVSERNTSSLNATTFLPVPRNRSIVSPQCQPPSCSNT
jgi:DNA-binding transcriptional LysR family regulator